MALVHSRPNRHDVTQLLALVDAIPPIGGKRGRPLSKPLIVQGDRGYEEMSPADDAAGQLQESFVDESEALEADTQSTEVV
jgi:hypothetical protein